MPSVTAKAASVKSMFMLEKSHSAPKKAARMGKRLSPVV
jgi:hypothetical protein